MINLIGTQASESVPDQCLFTVCSLSVPRQTEHQAEKIPILRLISAAILGSRIVFTVAGSFCAYCDALLDWRGGAVGSSAIGLPAGRGPKRGVAVVAAFDDH